MALLQSQAAYVENVDQIRQVIHSEVVDREIPLPTLTQPWRAVQFDPLMGSIYTRKVSNFKKWQDSSKEFYKSPIRILVID